MTALGTIVNFQVVKRAGHPFHRFAVGFDIQNASTAIPIPIAMV